MSSDILQSLIEAAGTLFKPTVRPGRHGYYFNHSQSDNIRVLLVLLNGRPELHLLSSFLYVGCIQDRE
jgi:hypothetical protein